MSEEHRFTSAAAALETFKRGSRGPRWKAAAEYLIRNANPDTRMLLDYAIQRTREELGQAPKVRKRGLHPAWIAAAVIAAALVLGAFFWLLATLLSELKCA